MVNYFLQITSVTLTIMAEIIVDNISTTWHGLTCQKWTLQTPHAHSYTPENYPNTGLGNHNYCRNPDGRSRPWCFTKDNYYNYDWEYCDVGVRQYSCRGMYLACMFRKKKPKNKKQNKTKTNKQQQQQQNNIVA